MASSTSPTVRVLGVHRLTVTDELVREQKTILYGEDDNEVAERHIREQLRSAIQIELLVSGRDHRFRMKDFTQRQDGVPRENWQAVWAENFLTLDGEEVIAIAPFQFPDGPDLRIAFFLHFWNPVAPLETSYGPVSCPSATAMPKRLATLAPYEFLD